MSADAGRRFPGRNDKDLVTAEEGFEAVFAREYSAMVRLAYLMVGSGPDAEGVVQRAFVDVYRQGPRAYNGAYVRRAVINGCHDHSRRLTRWRRRLAALETHLVEPEPDGEHVDLVDALRRLPTRQRAAVVLRYYGELSTDEIAVVLAVAPNTVKSLLRRGLTRLREIGEP